MIEAQKVTMIQSMCKAATGEDLSVAEALVVKSIGDSTLCMDSAEFLRAVGKSLQTNERMLCSLQIPANSFASWQAACVDTIRSYGPVEMAS